MDQYSTQTIIELEGTPSSGTVSWRDKMTDVKDQGPTPTCYGYTIQAIIEALYYDSFPLAEGETKKSFSVAFPLVSVL